MRISWNNNFFWLIIRRAGGRGQAGRYCLTSVKWWPGSWKRKNQTASLSFLFTFSSTFISSNSNLSLTKLPTSKELQDPIQGWSDFQKNISPSLDGNSWKNCPKVKPSCATTISPPSYFSFVLFIKKKIECFRQLDSSFDFIDTHVLLSFWLQSLMQIVMMWR